MPKTIQIECSGYSVYSDWYEGKDTDRIILTLIGWTSNRKNYHDLLTAIVEKTGMSALVFEYSGHGDSPFKIEETRPAQHFLEVIYVFDQLKKKHPNAKISVMGASYGGFLATQLTKYRDFDKLILRVPAIYKPSEFYTLNGEINSESGWASKDAYRRDVGALAKHPLLARASNFKGKVLVVVHGDDELVPKETTDAYINAFKPDIYEAKGFPHNLGKVPREKIVEYQNRIIDWLTK
jgi:predicted alpha/beta-fold hydrolase